jgi:hypothetical protein
MRYAAAFPDQFHPSVLDSLRQTSNGGITRPEQFMTPAPRQMQPWLIPVVSRPDGLVRGRGGHASSSRLKIVADRNRWFVLRRIPMSASLADHRGDLYLADVRRIVIEELNKMAPQAGEPAWQTRTPVPVPPLG